MQVAFNITIPEQSEMYQKLHAASKASGYSIEKLVEVLFNLGGRQELDRNLSLLKKHHPKFRVEK